MYKPELSYEEFIKKEQQKYPELNLNDIETLKKKCQANEDLPAIRGIILILSFFFLKLRFLFETL